MKPVEWPYEDVSEGRANRSSGSQMTIAEYLADHKFDCVINLSLCSGRQKAFSFVTQGYKTRRRMAVDYLVPFITDVKCTKMFVEARSGVVLIKMSGV